MTATSRKIWFWRADRYLTCGWQIHRTGFGSSFGYWLAALHDIVRPRAVWVKTPAKEDMMTELRPGARIRLVDSGITLLDHCGEVKSYTMERGPDGLRVTLHMPEPVSIEDARNSAD